MVKIENFNTGAKVNPNVKNINLDPSENIKNKKKIKQLLKNIVESNNKDLEKNINNTYHQNAKLKCFHPINNINGIDEIYNKQKSWAVGSDINKINVLIKKIGLEFDLNNNEMDVCLQNSKFQDEILEQRIEAQKKYKIESTPTIIVNGKKYTKKIDYKIFKKTIDKNL